MDKHQKEIRQAKLKSQEFNSRLRDLTILIRWVAVLLCNSNPSKHLVRKLICCTRFMQRVILFTYYVIYWSPLRICLNFFHKIYRLTFHPISAQCSNDTTHNNIVYYYIKNGSFNYRILTCHGM